MNNALLKQEIPEAIAATELAQCQDEKERFRVTGKDSANWCLRKIRALKAEIKDNARIAQEEVERIQKWLKNVNEPLENSISYFEGLLETYHREIYVEDPKLKTIKLPHGTLKLRAQQPEFKLDEQVFLEYLRKSGRSDYIEVIEKPKWGEYKKVVEVAMDGKTVVDTQTGEIVEGVRAELRPPKFSVEV
jgi:phage host-nuclease inhibitor protein Gam